MTSVERDASKASGAAAPQTALLAVVVPVPISAPLATMSRGRTRVNARVWPLKIWILTALPTSISPSPFLTRRPSKLLRWTGALAISTTDLPLWRTQIRVFRRGFLWVAGRSLILVPLELPSAQCLAPPTTGSNSFMDSRSSWHVRFWRCGYRLGVSSGLWSRRSSGRHGQLRLLSQGDACGLWSQVRYHCHASHVLLVPAAFWSSQPPG